MSGTKFNFTISIVIPAYNEEKRLPSTLLKLEAYFTAVSFPYEILVVDDGSADQTAKIVQNFLQSNSNIRLIQNGKNYGKGYSVQQGVFYSSKNYVLIYDADGATPIEELTHFIPLLSTTPNSIFIGSRILKSDKVIRKKLQWHLQLLGRCFHALLFTLTPGLQDTQCGFKLFPKKTALRLFLRQTLKGFAFDVEILHAALQNDIPVIELPVNWSNIEGSKINVLIDSWVMLASLFKILGKSLAGHYTFSSNIPAGRSNELMKRVGTWGS